jgi:hypothetical protein
MAFLPLNIMLAAFFIFGIVWGWEGQEERQFFAVLSSIFMFPLWLTPLYSLVGTSVNTVLVAITPGWLPTVLVVNILWWNVVLMYFTGAHMMQTLGRTEPVGKALKRLRK